MTEDDLNDRERIEQEIARLRHRAAALEETLQSRPNVSSAKFELEERCKQILETASHGICSLDRDFKTLFVNKTMAGMLGYRGEEMLGRSLSDFVVEEERVDYDFQASQRRQGFRGQYERKLRHKDGSVRHFFISATPIMDMDGNFSGSFAVCADIAERQRAEQILRESELRYRTLYDNAGDSIALMRDSIIVDVNRKVLETFCGEWEDFIGKSPDWFSPPFQPDGCPSLEKGEAMLESVAQNGLHRFEWQFHRKDGSLFDSEVTLSKVEILGESFILALMRDISERKRQEAALQKQEEEFRAIFETADDAIFIKDRRLRYTRVNPALIRLFGASEQDVLDQNALAFFGADAAAHIADVDNRVLQGETIEEELTKPVNGFLRTFHVIKVPMRDNQGTIVGLCGIARDITERQQAEQALRESRERYRIISEIISDFAFSFRVGKDGDFTREWTTESLETMTGYSTEERDAQGGPLSPLFAADRDNIMAEITAMLSDLRPRTFEFETVTKAKQPLWLRCRLRPIWDETEKRVIRIIGAGQDITALKSAEENRARLETQVQRTQKLESLGVLAGGIAHDFNNMLMTILGNADLALLDLSPAHPAYECLRSIEVASRRAAELCRQMLAYSGRGKFMVQKLDVNEVIREMSHLLEVSIAKNVVLRYELAPQLPLIEADATQIRQVVMNLITNASEAIGGKSGIVSIKTSAMECTAEYLHSTFIYDNIEEGFYVFFEVSDNGCGMSRETAQKIFDPFFTTKFTGRGLGLAAVLGIVRGHHGALKVYSELGHGTTFKILLPAQSPEIALPQQNTQCRIETAAWRCSGTILLVDDEETVRILTKRMLEKIGFSVLLAADGREALDIFRQRTQDIDGVLLDLTMPHMDGETTFRELRRIRAGVRVIMCSGYAEQEVTARFAGKGLAGFIQKPYQFAVLRDTLRALFESTGKA